MSKDTRFCYGACCLWFGPIQEVGVNSAGLPCCPKCGGVLYEMDSEKEWWDGIEAFERGDYPSPTAHPHPGYKAMWRWAQEQALCFRNISQLVRAFGDAKGMMVDTDR